MSKSSKKSKKKNSLEKPLLQEGVVPPPPPSSFTPMTLPQKVDKPKEPEIKDPQKENDPSGTEKSKKKRKKKKKTHTESTSSVTEGETDNSQIPVSDSNINKEMEESLAKLRELTIIKLPTPPPPPVIETQKIDQEAVVTNNNGTESNKKKKKKNKQKNQPQEKNNQEPNPPQKSVTSTNLQQPNPPQKSVAYTNSQQPAPPYAHQNSSNASYFKVERPHDSSVLIVSNPTDKMQNLSKSIESKIDNNSHPNIIMGPGSQCLVKNNEHMPFPNIFQGMYSHFQQTQQQQQQPYVTLTSVEGNPKPNQGLNSMESGEPSQKTKAQLKAERRAVQESQRAAKEANKRASNIIDSHQLLNKSSPTNKQNLVKNTSHVKASKEGQKSFFSHLPVSKSPSSLQKHLQSDDFIHPAIIAAGAKYAKNNLMDSNACCIDILLALKNVIRDYRTPPNKELRRDLGSKMEKLVVFLSKCRPLSVGTLNAMKFIKLQICNPQENQTDDKAKVDLCEQVEKYIQDSISLAVEAISKSVSSEIKSGDVILTYAYSSVVRNALLEASQQKKRFRVIVIDSRPTLEGREILNDLLKHGIECSYAFMSALSYVMKDVTKVIISAHAVGASGYVMSRIGTSQLALLASISNTPFIVCCETYKFCERALIDSYVENELGDPESLTKLSNSQTNVLENWKEIPTLDLVNLLYDITPPRLISKVITEKSLSM